MSNVRIRDAETRKHLEVAANTPILRVPWEVSNVRGAVIVEDGFAYYDNRLGEQIARTKPGQLGDCKPGDVVLMQYDESTREDPRVWWLVEVVVVDGLDALLP
jgi:hypothetical protein